MKTLSIPLQLLNEQGVTTWTVCWEVVDRAGNAYRATQHDRALTITTSDFGGVYEPFRAISASSVRSNPDMAVDNLNVETFADIYGITRADIEGGLFDGVRFTIFACDWQNPDAGQVILRSGTVGELIVEREGRLSIELRGLAQALQQNIVRTYGPSCDADLGDTRCGVDLAALAQTVTVTSVQDVRRAFTASAFAGTAGEYLYGVVEFLSGANTGVRREIRSAAAGGVFTFVEPVGDNIEVGDSVEIRPGCDKTFATCRDRYTNSINYRGFPYVPGRDAQIKAGSL